MKVVAVLLLTVLPLFPGAPRGVSQKRSTINEANKAWPAFFKKFRLAVRAKNRTTLRPMLAPGLLFSLGHHSSDRRDDAFKFWDEDGGKGWKAFNRILNQGTVPLAPWWNNGHKPSRPSRVAPAAANRRNRIDRERVDWYAIFEYSEDGNWHCVIFQQCCD